MTDTPESSRGTPHPLILRPARKGALHDRAISERIQQSSRHVLQIKQGSLDPALPRLDHQGSIEAGRKVSDLGGPDERSRRASWSTWPRRSAVP
jgi:DNA-binding PadR family transcriptional regulator